MLKIFAVLAGGILTGRLLLGRRLSFAQPLITVIIWALLFLLGLEAGSDPAVVGGLATVALLCNILRELFTLLAAPMVARCFGPLAAVSIGGATTFDTTLPIITRAAGRPYAVVSIFHGCALDFSVPFLVTLFCSL